VQYLKCDCVARLGRRLQSKALAGELHTSDPSDIYRKKLRGHNPEISALCVWLSGIVQCHIVTVIR
jgi:hypothetical protein